MRDDAFIDRLRSCIADEPVAAFARRCGFSEGLIRSYLKGEKKPGMDRLVRMAEVAGVTIDWLATGRVVLPSNSTQTQQPRAFQTDAVFRQLEKIGELLDALPEHKRTDLLAEFLSRAEDAAEFISVVRQINELRAAQKKSA